MFLAAQEALKIIADNLKIAGWSWGRVSAIDSNGRMIWTAGAHRGNDKQSDQRVRAASNEKEQATAGCRGKHAELALQRGRWLHR